MLKPTWIFLVVILAWLAKGEDNTNCGILGSPADINETPWLVSIVFKDKHVCAGAIYSLKFIITTSDCVNGLSIANVMVRAGTSHSQEGGSLVGVCKPPLIHERANATRYATNLALLELCEPLKRSNTIQEIHVAKNEPVDGEDLTVSGWGESGFWKTHSSSCWAKESLILRKAVVKVYNVTKCVADQRRWYKPRDKNLHELNICASKPEKSCSYSQGSPLVSGNNLVGLLSKGDCSEKPDAFTSLAHHIDWLETRTKKMR